MGNFVGVWEDKVVMSSKKKKALVSILIITSVGLLMIIIFFPEPFMRIVDTEKSSIHQRKKPNIIILLLDCMRADHLSCYGYTRNTSPTIDALATQGIKFNYAISQAPWTFPSVFSLLSGHYPHKHGAWPINKETKSLWRKLMVPSKTISLLPALLQKAGYTTWGFSTNTYINKERMQQRGFNEFKYIWKAPAMEVVNYGIEKIRLAEKTGNHFFLYLHFMDAHHPLQPPAQYYNFFPTSDGEKNRKIHEGLKFKRYVDQQGDEFDNYRDHKVSLYDGTIRYMDAEIGRLINELKSSSLMSSTIIVILADHGDEFWEHAAFEAAHYKNLQIRQGVGHGHTLFQELIRVPLIITTFYPQGEFPPLKQQPTEIEHTIQLVDLVPTLLDLIGLQPIANCDGITLLPLLNKSSFSLSNNNVKSNFRSIFSESTPDNVKVSIIEYPYKFIYAHKETYALFNLENDPQEKNNLVDKKTTLASNMLEKILRFLEEKPPKTEETSLSKDDLEKLKALGYIDNSKKYFPVEKNEVAN